MLSSLDSKAFAYFHYTGLLSFEVTHVCPLSIKIETYFKSFRGGLQVRSGGPFRKRIAPSFRSNFDPFILLHFFENLNHSRPMVLFPPFFQDYDFPPSLSPYPPTQPHQHHLLEHPRLCQQAHHPRTHYYQAHLLLSSQEELVERLSSLCHLSKLFLEARLQPPPT
jgi:hypothetical protein